MGKKKVMVLETGLKVIKEIKVKVPLEILALLMFLEERFNTEFAVVCKMDWIADDTVRIHSPYIPEQEVTHGSVELKEVILRKDYPVIIHSHPKGIKSFSGTDDEFINQNFDLSLVYNDRKFTDAVINIPIKEGVYLQFDKVKVHIEVDIDDSILKKIKKANHYLYTRKENMKVFDEEDWMNEDWYYEKYKYYR